MNLKQWTLRLGAGVGLLLAAWAPLTAEDVTPVKPGDKILLDYTCRTADGALAFTTEEQSAGSARLSPMFAGGGRVFKPVEVAAMTTEDPRPAWAVGSPRILQWQLATKVAGMVPGERKTVGVEVPPLGKGQNTIGMARVRMRPKTARITPDRYRHRMGEEPQVGRPYVVDPAIPGTVASVSDTEVVVRFQPEVGKKVQTPIGPGVIRDLDNRWGIEIQVEPGALVRTGEMVGRVRSVDERTIVLDYSHPFGGEALTCDVSVDSIQPE